MIETSYSLKNRVKRAFSRSAKTYNNWATPQNEVARKLISFSYNLNLKGNTVDVGCGTGLLTTHLINHYYNLDIIGIDISDTMLSYYENINSRVVYGDMESLPFANNYFNSSFSSFALHWTNIKKSLVEMIRVTSGYIFIALPIENSLSQFSFPFPKADILYDIINRFNLRIIVNEIRRFNIPFSGINLLKYFHYTGTTVNPSNNSHNISKSKLNELANKCINQKFEYIVLFLVVSKLSNK